MIKEMTAEEKRKLDMELISLLDSGGFGMEGTAKNAFLMLGPKSTWEEAQQYVYNLVENLKGKGRVDGRLNRAGRNKIFGKEQSLSMETLHSEYLKTLK